MFDATMSILERALDMRMRQHEVHTSNIANANVPQYKARKIEFDSKFQEALQGVSSSQPRVAQEKDLQAAVAKIQAEIIDDPNAVIKSNGNSVDMEREQTELAKNTIGIQTAVQLVNKKFAMAKYVLGEGR